jgi:hypothetical protein
MTLDRFGRVDGLRGVDPDEAHGQCPASAGDIDRVAIDDAGDPPPTADRPLGLTAHTLGWLRRLGRFRCPAGLGRRPVAIPVGGSVRPRRVVHGARTDDERDREQQCVVPTTHRLPSASAVALKNCRDGAVIAT